MTIFPIQACRLALRPNCCPNEGYSANEVTLTYGTHGVTRIDGPTGDDRYILYTYDTVGLIEKVELKNALRSASQKDSFENSVAEWKAEQTTTWA